MTEPISHTPRNENRRMILWFLIALLIALLPWFLLAQDQIPSNKNTATDSSAKECQKACTGFPL